MQTNPHVNHRTRLRERFLRSGLSDFAAHNALELFLFYAVPRRDTNPIAHALLERFGTLSQVLEAPAEELAKVAGMGDSAATFLSLITSVGRYYLVNRTLQETILTSIEKCGQYMMPYFYGRRNETVFALCLDAKCKVLCCKEIGEGSVNSVGVPIRRIVETALGVNATSVVLAHNHPSGLALPSGEDVQTTRRVAMALDAVEIGLVDHLIVADDDFVSLAQSGLYSPDECRLVW